VLFSHPKNYTPVCTTELGYMAKIKHEFDRRGVKIIGLSVDPVAEHAGWSSDIAATQGSAPNYPLIGDADYTVAKLYNMLPANATGHPAQRSAADNQTVRNVFVVGPDKKIKVIMVYDRRCRDARRPLLCPQPLPDAGTRPGAVRVDGYRAG